MRAWRTVVTATTAALSLAAAVACTSPTSTERFDEDLLLRPLPDGSIQAAFHFTIDSGEGPELNSQEDEQDWEDDADGARRNASSFWSRETSSATAGMSSHFRLLPRTLIQIAQAANTREFKLSISAGTWQYTAWGEPTLDILSSDPSASESTAQQEQSKAWTARGGRAVRRDQLYEEEQEKQRRFSHSTAAKILGDDAVGNGAELWASFLSPPGSGLPAKEGPSKGEHAKLSWRKLTSALAGLFCASLDTTLSPRIALEPSEPLLFSQSERSHTSRTPGRQAPFMSSNSTADSVLLHAFAPSEFICTENLTPFLKLLPCRSASAGLAQLLNPHALFSSSFHGMSVHVQRIGSESETPSATNVPVERWRVHLRIQAVYTAAQARLKGRSAEELALRPLFARNITQACPMASSSNVYIPRPPTASDLEQSTKDTEDDDDDDELDQSAGSEILLIDAEGSDSYTSPSWPRLYTLDPVYKARRRRRVLRKRPWRASPHFTAFSDTALSGLAQAYDLAPALASETPSLELYRTHTSTHPTKGAFLLTLTNWHRTEPVRARYYDEIPWWMEIWTHSLKVIKVEDVSDKSARVQPESATPKKRRGSAGAKKSEEDDIVRFVDDFLCPPILAIHYEPTAGRDLDPDATPGSGRPSLFELDLRIPASSKVQIQMEYNLAFLRYTEHPPGPQKGWGVPPGILAVLSQDGHGSGGPSGEATFDEQARLCPVEVPRRRGRKAAGLGLRSGLPPLSRPIPVAGQGIRRRIYTEPALIELAVPDFSMIYNLILFTSTEIALFFGSMFNLLVRRFGDVVLSS
ncbi:Subunit of the glycosylphosphatidylinositol transamidase complex-like protein [Tilletia horrida]|uniref:Subunit of the glycosylphosphatidylinositol transamidase complex-like protein n=1 Tax=Tilletia horrida TaxID=155126 RepID=A0AAN6GWP7_9BASI|nr:Subunit of the glycosylphosphatidylinositol transamidase complex-like protein [Tilletia horrida]